MFLTNQRFLSVALSFIYVIASFQAVATPTSRPQTPTNTSATELLVSPIETAIFVNNSTLDLDSTLKYWEVYWPNKSEIQQFRKDLTKAGINLRIPNGTLTYHNNQIHHSSLPAPLEVVSQSPLQIKYKGETWVHNPNQSMFENSQSLSKMISKNEQHSSLFINSAFAEASVATAAVVTASIGGSIAKTAVTGLAAVNAMIFGAVVIGVIAIGGILYFVFRDSDKKDNSEDQKQQALVAYPATNLLKNCPTKANGSFQLNYVGQDGSTENSCYIDMDSSNNPSTLTYKSQGQRTKVELQTKQGSLKVGKVTKGSEVLQLTSLQRHQIAKMVEVVSDICKDPKKAQMVNEDAAKINDMIAAGSLRIPKIALPGNSAPKNSNAAQ